MSETVLFKAPWGKLLTTVTVLTSVLLLGIVCLGWFAGPGQIKPTLSPDRIFWLLAMVGLPLLLVLSTGIYAVRGYRIEGSVLYIQRVGWQNRIDLTALHRAESEPAALDTAVRLWGNGGFFSFTGWFRSQQHGRFQVFGTDPSKGVMLTFPERKVFITPDDPQHFIAIAQAASHTGLPSPTEPDA
ncbi:MAG: PH domain-containing protein [Cyanobacteria bacterium P01_H01_bin.121]